ncbi:MAG: c-type cytochrome domain-containing protein [Ignavibacteria bacterium]|nr:c-type cytochrome domain-containing protein [Ignavibacteria bacterium]
MKKIISLCLLLFYVSCDDTSTNIDDKEIPISNVSYSQHIQPIFNVKCINCHGVGTTEAGLDLTTWSGTVADPSIVVPNEPDNSRLIWTIEGRPGFPFMPPIGSPYRALTQNQIRGVKTWIAEGALNN